MLFNPKDAECKKKSAMYLAKLLQGEDAFEITKKARRSLRQNSYLHLLLQYLAARTYNETEYVKRDWYKKTVNPDIFCYQRYDTILKKVIWDVRSSKNLTKDEMRLSIERLKDWSAKVAEVVLPDAVEKEDGTWEIEDKDLYNHILMVIDNAKEFVK